MQRISEHEILSAVGSFYEAAQKATREAWVEVWQQLAVMFRSGTGGFTFYDTRTSQFTVMITDADQALLSNYEANHKAESRIRVEVGKLKAGERFNRADVIPDDEFVSTDIYEGFYKPAGIFHFEYQVFLIRPGMHGAVSFSRPPGEPNFDEHELQVMRVLLPHLERAFQLYASLHDTSLESRVMAAAADRISRNLIVTNCELELVFANSGGRELLETYNGLNLNADGRIVAATPADTAKLAERIVAVCKLEGDSPGEVMLLPDPNRRRPLEVLVAPFEKDHYPSFSDQPLAILFASDPEQSSDAMDETLIKMYGLTPAEARFAALLAEINDMKEVCQKLGIQESTGRTHLKRIFSKTDTNRQSALIKLIFSGPASIQ